MHRPTSNIPEPTLQTVQGMDTNDPFWPRGDLGQADEDWSADAMTQEGINAFRVQQSCCEELRRTGREVRQLLSWVIGHQECLSNLKRRSSEGELLEPH